MGGRIGGSISSRVFWDSCSLQRERWENSMASSGFLSLAEREMGERAPFKIILTLLFSSGPRCVKATWTWSTVSSFTVPVDSSEPLAIPTEKEVNNSKELEGLSDPMRKDVSQVHKKINAINKELKSLGHTCQKKEKEYRDALEAFNEKNREKVQLITKLMELMSESEKAKMKKLEELSKNIESLK
ncbi:uncharacterized protein LOC103955202 [Pyrus x bretschneideri]|uniref:uncharacterized protein LOC103955202 n=1 Tax=Pyrus x bretschneideri TaxID=225117 RepID=UPI00202EAF91|nr:uncharacterized protein LOC103955202 [Pyrus x bretschneideri]